MIYTENNSFSRDHIKQLLLDYAIRPTNQRVEIANVLLTQPQHLSADQVLAGVNRLAAIVSKATVYNTLNLFAEKGLIRQVIIDSGKVFYDSNTAIHHHIFNEDTGVLQDVQATEIAIENMPALPAGIERTGVDVIIRVRNKS
jgi:Fur family transcriptional regulator, iron response regulator